MTFKPLLNSFKQVRLLKINLNLNKEPSNVNLSNFFKTSSITRFDLKSYSTSAGSEFDFSQSKNETQESVVQKTHSVQDIEPFKDSKDFAATNDEWSSSFFGVGSKSFDKEVIDILLAPIDTKDIEIKPGWGLVPRGPSTVTSKNLSREYALICLGRFVSQARGEQDYFDRSDISVSAEGARSNALTRCCKDLGIASELWDPSFIRKFKAENCEQVWAEHTSTKKRRLLWRLKDNPIDYPYRLC